MFLYRINTSFTSWAQLSGCGRHLAVMLACVLAPNLSVAADAQSSKAARAGGGLEEVTVTARKTTENLQDTPIAISAMSGDALAESGINNLADLTKSVPGLDMANKGDPNAAPYIRGVGQRQNKATLDPAVAIYMDDVYLGRPDGALMDLADVAGIQVLRGPQGTLFGRNATGGAIVISPKKPTDEVEGMFLARTGSYNKQDLQFAVNTPITDNVFTRLALGQTKRDGYSTNLTTGNDNIDNENRKFALAQMRWLMGDYTTVDLALNYSKQDEYSRSQHCKLHPELVRHQNNQNGSNGEPVDLTQYLGTLSLFGLLFGQDYAKGCYDNQKLVESGQYNKFYNSSDPIYRTEAKGASLTIEHEFELFDFKSVTSIRKVGLESTVDLEGTSLQMFDQSNIGSPHKTTQITQEFQISGAALDGDLDYATGIYYWQEESIGGVEYSLTGPMVLRDPFFGAPLAAIIRTDYLTRDTNNKSLALFGQGTYHVSDNFDATFGLRYTTEERKLTATRIDSLPNTEGGYGWYSDISALTDAISPLLGLFGGAFLGNEELGENLAQIITDLQGSYVYRPTLNPFAFSSDLDDWVIDPFERVEQGLTNAREVSDSNSFDAWTPMLNFTYFFPDTWLDRLDADSGMVYFTWSEGFRAGGLVTENTLWDKETEEHYATITPYEPEEVSNFELGAKFDLFGNLRFNTALFMMKYTNKQETLVKQDPVNPLQVQAQLGNIGAATIAGLEMELNYLPTENLDLTLNFNYTKATYDKFDSIVYPKCSPPLSGTEEGGDFCGFFVTEETLNRKDEKYPVVTPIKVFTSAQYRMYSPFALITPRLEAIYSSGNYGHFDRSSWNLTKDHGIWKQDAFMTYNARVNFDFYNEQTRVALAVNNISDERPITGGKALVDTFGGGTIAYGQPRMWTLELIHKF